MPWTIYGANGYTGRLVAEEAARRGLRPLLAGRSTAVEELAGSLGLPARVFALEDPPAVKAALRDLDLVLHCAGPFVGTSPPMVQACLATRTHYLDITGEIEVFETIFSQGMRAVERGAVLLPGVGFDVVPTDCLAARLARTIDGPSLLELAFSTRGTASRGTLKTMVEHLPDAGCIRRDGQLVTVPLAWDTKEIEFGCGLRWAMTIPWGDLSTAHQTTGIPNIRVYTAQPHATIRRLRRFRWLLPLLGLRPVKRLLQRRIERKVTGPSADERASVRTYLWGRVENDRGETEERTFDVVEGYRFTAVAAVECVRRVLEGEVAPGAWTPSLALGDDLVDRVSALAES